MPSESTLPLQVVYKKIADLKAYAGNPRKNDAAVDRMIDCIQEFGFRIPIVAKSDGTIVDGHLRYKAACRLGLAEVPIVLADELSEAQIKAFRLVANQSANWAEWDEDLLKAELTDLKALDFDLNLTGFDFQEITQLLEEDAPVHEDFSLFNAGHDTPVITQPGDLWICGEHRILCGDSLDPQSYATLLDGQKAALTITDPPYNIDYDPEGNATRTKLLGGAKKPIANDALGRDFGEFLDQTCQRILENTSGGIYIFMSTKEQWRLHAAFENAGGHIGNWMVWVKGHFTIGQSDYQRQFEPFLYGWKERGKHYWCGDRNQSDVWHAAKPKSSALHPTMKPVSIIERAVKNSSQRGDSVLDPFAGSGTTLVAAEHLGRKARLIELDPQYVDLILQRWQNLTGEEALCTRTGETFEAMRQSC